jgi:hypothetical protein
LFYLPIQVFDSLPGVVFLMDQTNGNIDTILGLLFKCRIEVAPLPAAYLSKPAYFLASRIPNQIRLIEILEELWKLPGWPGDLFQPIAGLSGNANALVGRLVATLP